MSRKHYEAIAEIIHTQIKKATTTDAYSTAEAIARNYARIAALDNPRFNTVRFLAACGIAS